MAVENSNLANMDWDQYLVSGPLQGEESMEDFLQRMDNVSSGGDIELDSISPGVSRDFAFAVQPQSQELTSI